MTEDLVGTVTHYFGKLGVAAIQIIHGHLHTGDAIRVLGHTTDFTQTVESMQIEHETVESASEGESVGVKVVDRAREGDHVFRVHRREPAE